MDQSRPFSSFSVNDVDAAYKFYSEIMGLEVEKVAAKDGCPDMLTLKLSEDSEVMVYEKPDHVPATFTILNFPVTDIEKAVRKFKSKGIHFEQYERTDAEGISRDEGPLMAWFKDPAGNFISVMEQEVACERNVTDQRDLHLNH